jgi:hypothetical protein
MSMLYDPKATASALWLGAEEVGFGEHHCSLHPATLPHVKLIGPTLVVGELVGTECPTPKLATKFLGDGTVGLQEVRELVAIAATVLVDRRPLGPSCLRIGTAQGEAGPVQRAPTLG